MENVNCVFKLNISYFIKRIIENLMDDISNWHQLKEMEEFKLWSDLYDRITQDSCETLCLGCVDYALLSNIYYNFINQMITLTKQYHDILSEIKNNFDITNNDVIDDIGIIITIMLKPQLIDYKISEKNNFDKLISDSRNTVNALFINYLSRYKNAQLNDSILDGAELGQNQKISYTPYNIQDFTSIYVDQNVVTKYQNDDNFRKQMDNFYNKKYQFVISPYIIEDGIKMNRLYLKNYLKSVISLTHGVLIAKIDKKLEYVKEEINVLVDRVLLWRDVTRAAEERKFYDAIYQSYIFPEFSRNTDICQKINKDIRVFFNSLEKDRGKKAIFDKLDDHNTILRGFRKISTSDFSKEKISLSKDEDIMNAISEMCSIFDTINYQTEPLKDKNKIKSSYQDAEHLKHAWKADYFVTEDEKLLKRGKFIYSLLGLKTEVINIKQLKEMITDSYKTL